MENLENMFFLRGLSNRYLKELYIAAKKEMKKRDLLIYNKSTELYDSKILRKDLSLKKFDNITSNNNLLEFKDINIDKKTLNVKNYKTPKNSKTSYLHELLMEDWSNLFAFANNNAKDFYVYYHTDPRESSLIYLKYDIELKFLGKPFYIGKGKNDRYKSLNSRSSSHRNKIKTLLNMNIPEDKIFIKLQENLNEREALELESKLITFFGCNGEYSYKRKYFSDKKGGILLNSDTSIRPENIEEIILMRS